MPEPAGRAAREPSFVPSKSRHPGRPAYLTPEAANRFMTALRAGNSYNDAARYAGLKPKTVERWLARGRGHDSRPPTPEYVAFARLAEESKAAARVFVVGNLVARSQVDTRAAELWLRVHGGPEWREDEMTAPAPDAQNIYIDARQQSMEVLVVPADQVPGFVHRQLEARRAAMPVEPISNVEERRSDGPSHARSAGLREEG